MQRDRNLRSKRLQRSTLTPRSIEKVVGNDFHDVDAIEIRENPKRQSWSPPQPKTISFHSRHILLHIRRHKNFHTNSRTNSRMNSRMNCWMIRSRRLATRAETVVSCKRNPRQPVRQHQKQQPASSVQSSRRLVATTWRDLSSQSRGS